MKTQALEKCVANCIRCHRSCLEAVDHCLRTAEAAAVSPGHARLLMDCAQICQTAADFMIRESPLHGETCRVCAVICQMCADECTRLSKDGPLSECSADCQACAESCRSMAHPAS